MKFNKGDLVSRKSYNNDVIFKVCNIKENGDGERVAYLKGINVRLQADSPESDLAPVTNDEMRENTETFEVKMGRGLKRKSGREKKSPKLFKRETNILMKPGKVVHIDGDGEYLKLCLEEYEKAGIEAYGFEKAESEQFKIIQKVLNEIHPDILVITGHDGFLKKAEDYEDIGNYYNSKYFIKSVREARKYETSLDDLIIIAGACQSHYEGILAAGANFASSPGRILIHALEPVKACNVVALTAIDKIVTAKDISEMTLSGLDGIGGLSSKGKYRDVAPKPRYNLGQGEVLNDV